MKKKLVFIFSIYLLNLLGCSHSSTSIHPVSNISGTSTPENTIIMAFHLLEEKNITQYHELTNFKMAANYKTSYIATDPFALSPFENFLTLQYLSSIINESTYDIIEVQQQEKDSLVTVRLQIPNYTSVLKQSLPEVISSYRDHYSTTNYENFDHQKSLLKTINDMIISSCHDSETIELINTFKLKYINDEWYIVDSGILYEDITTMIQLYNRSL